MADPTTTVVNWDSAKHQCVANPATGLRPFEELQAQQDFERVEVDRGDAYGLLAKKFVAAAAQIQKSLASQNLVRLYLNQAYRTILCGALKDGYEAGRGDAMLGWRSVFDDFIDQMIVAGTNAIEEPAALVVGVGATAVEAVEGDS